MTDETIAFYDRHAEEVCARYEALTADSVWSSMGDLLPLGPGWRLTSVRARGATRRGSPPAGSRWSRPSPPRGCVAKGLAAMARRGG